MSGLLESKSDEDEDLNESSLSSMTLTVGSLIAVFCFAFSLEGPDWLVTSLRVCVAAIGSEWN